VLIELPVKRWFLPSFAREQSQFRGAVSGVVGQAGAVDGARLRIAVGVEAIRPSGPVNPASRHEIGANRANEGECPYGIRLKGWAAGRSRDRVAQGARKVPPRLRPDVHDAGWQAQVSEDRDLTPPVALRPMGVPGPTATVLCGLVGQPGFSEPRAGSGDPTRRSRDEKDGMEIRKDAKQTQRHHG
jgi:hypothetical protein